MGVRVEENDGEGEDVGSVGVGEDTRITPSVSFGEFEHVTINLLRFSGKAEGLEEEAEGVDERGGGEIHEIDERVHRGDVFGFSIEEKRRH